MVYTVCPTMLVMVMVAAPSSVVPILPYSLNCPLLGLGCRVSSVRLPVLLMPAGLTFMVIPVLNIVRGAVHGSLLITWQFTTCP